MEDLKPRGEESGVDTHVLVVNNMKYVLQDHDSDVEAAKSRIEQLLQRGDAPIKQQYIKPLLPQKRPATEFDEETVEEASETAENYVVVDRKQAPSKRAKKRKEKERMKTGLCGAIAKGLECPFKDNCKFSHDVKGFLEAKRADISDKCYIFEQRGICPYGVTCRFASAHMTEDMKNIVKDGADPSDKELNNLPRDLQTDLRKRKKQFPKSVPLIQLFRKEKQKRNSENGFGGQQPVVVPSEEPTLFDKETPHKVDERKKIDFQDKIYVAPLTTIGNLPFRRICTKFGADITCGEMALATNLLEGQNAEWALLKRHPSESIFGVQLCGAHMDTMTKCAELLSESVSVDFIDINCGCPIDLVYKQGAGSALLEHTRRLADMGKGMSQVIDTPLTVKLRIGKDEKCPTVHKIFPDLHAWGFDAVTLHGRSRQQRYTKYADWDYIKKCASLTKLPVLGNGDIYSWEDYYDHMNNTGVTTCMLARGVIIKPWLSTEIKERKYWDISATERLDIVRDFCNFGLDHWGSDDKGVENTRKFFLEWQSMLYRYVPVGLLEVLPPKINHRPPPFEGRSELETLLASPDPYDWIKISTMFLGPPPPGFTFTAKHKSNSYNG